MKNRLLLELIILFFVLPTLACGILGADPTPTPEPTATPAATPTPEPSPTPDLTADFVPYESPEIGLAVQYPADWFIRQDLFALTLATDEELLDTPEALEEGAVVALAAGDTTSLSSTDPVVLINEGIEQIELSEDLAIVDGPNSVTIQGQDGALARIEGTSDETGQGIVGLVVMIINGDRAAIGIAYTLQESEAEYLPIIEAVLNTIVIIEPIETEGDVSDTLPTLEPGTLVEGRLNGEPVQYLFAGTAGQPALKLSPSPRKPMAIIPSGIAGGCWE